MALLTDMQVEDLKLSSKEIREIYGIDELIADRAERTRLLREAYDYLYHGRDVPVGLLTEVQKAIEEQP